MLVAGGDRFKDRLMQCQPGLSLKFLERDCQQSLRACGIALRVCPASRHDQAFWFDDLAKDALRPMIIALGSEHMDSICAARAQFAAQDGTPEASRTHPADKMLRIGPGFEDQLARRVEDASDDEHPVGRFGSEVTSCGHLSSPFFAIHADNR